MKSQRKTKKQISMLLVFMLFMSILSQSAMAFDIGSNTMTNFITVKDGKIIDGENELKFASLNYPGSTTDDEFAQEDAIKTIATIGGQVTRSYVISVLTASKSNSSEAMVTAPGEFNEEAFLNLDRAIALCEKYGVRIIIPLVDHWDWHGGTASYAAFRGHTAADDLWLFYTDVQLRADFKETISYVLNRTNTVTGRQYKDEPAILAWETGNELGGYSQEKFPQEWTADIAAHIKSIDTNHLVMDGRFQVNEASLEDNNIDIISNHYYSGNYVNRTKSDTALIAGKKPFIIGEFGALTDAASVEDVFEEAYNDGVNGVMLWSLRPHNSLGGFNWHVESPGNWAAYHWPGFVSGDSYDETNIMMSLYKYANLMQGKEVPESIPAPDANDEPYLFPIESVDEFRWQGVVGASSYEVERSDNGNDGWQVIGEGTDCGTSGIRFFQDTSAKDGGTYYYRIRGKNKSGYSGYSNIQGVGAAKHVLIDKMYDFTRMYDYSSNLTVNTWIEGPQKDTFEDTISASETGFSTYFSPGKITSIKVKAYGTTSTVNPTISISPNDAVYTEIDAEKSDVDDTGKVTYSISQESIDGAARYVKIYLPKKAIKIARVEIEYANTDGTILETAKTISTDGLIIDNDLSKYAEISDNIKAISDKSSIENNNGYGSNNGEEGYVIYKTYGDMTSFRITSYSDSLKNPSDFKIYTSSNGSDYEELESSIESVDNDSTDCLKKYYSSFSLPQYTRYLKIIYPQGEAFASVISRVQIGYGDSLIELSSSSPNNVIEDAEYYYGSNELVKEAYSSTSGDVPNVSVSYDVKNNGNASLCYEYNPSSNWYGGVAKKLNDRDLSNYSAMQLWFKPDGSQNTLVFRLTDKSGIAYSYKYKMTSGDTVAKAIVVPFTNFVQDDWSVGMSGEKALDLNHIDEFYIGFSAQESAKGLIYLDDIKVLDPNVIDTFDDYSGYDLLVQNNYSRNTGGGSINLSLNSDNVYDGEHSLKFVYDIGSAGYGGETLTPNKLNLTGCNGIQMWVKPDGSRNSLTIQYVDQDGEYWETSYKLIGQDERLIYVPFDALRHPSWDLTGSPDDRPDPTKDIKSFSIYIGKTDDTINTKGTIYIDAIRGYKNSEIANGTVTINNVNNNDMITSLPYTITGTATRMKYVSILIGKQVLSAPVNADGTWSYDVKYIQNGDNIITACAQYSNGTYVTSDSRNVSVNVHNNAYVDGDPIDCDTVQDDDDTSEPEVNYIANPSFEKDDTGTNVDIWDITSWSKSDWMGKLQAGSAHSGNYKFVAYNDSDYKISLSQNISGLTEGIYELRAWTQSTGGQNYARMNVTSGEDIDLSENIPEGTDKFTQIKIPDIKVTTSGQVTIEFETDSAGGKWFAVDDIELVKTGEINHIKNSSFEEGTDGTTSNYYDIPEWSKSGPNADLGKIEINNKHTGKYQLAAWSDAAYELAIHQDVNDLTSGIYELRAWTRSTGGQDYLNLYVEGDEFDKQTKEIEATDEYIQTTIPNIVVTTSSQVTVGIETKGLANTWFTADDFELVKVAEIEAYNYVQNPGFEEGSTGETIWDIPSWVKSGQDSWIGKAEYNKNAHTGSYNFAAWNDSNYEMTLSQDISLPNGIYELSAWVRSKDQNPGRESCKMVAEGYGGDELSVEIPGGEKSYEEIKISNIKVTDGKITIAFKTKDSANNWVAVDDVKLIKTDELDDDDNTSNNGGNNGNAGGDDTSNNGDSSGDGSSNNGGNDGNTSGDDTGNNEDDASGDNTGNDDNGSGNGSSNNSGNGNTNSGDSYNTNNNQNNSNNGTVENSTVNWKYDNGKWYLFANSISVANEWKKVDGNWYYLNADGSMAVGWKYIGDKWYYLSQNGSMTVDWQYVNGKWYYLNVDGSMAVGWKYTQDKWYYLSQDGSMAVDWKYINEKWYYLNEDGSMAVGWKYVQGKWYFLYSDGSMASNTLISGYKLDKSGAWIN